MAQMPQPPGKLIRIETTPLALLNVYETDKHQDGSKIIDWAQQVAANLSKSPEKGI